MAANLKILGFAGIFLVLLSLSQLFLSGYSWEIIPGLIMGIVFSTFLFKKNPSIRGDQETILENSLRRSSKLDRYFCFGSLVFLIPSILFFKKLGFLFGLPFILNGFYGIITGRMFSIDNAPGLFFTGVTARIFGILEVIIGITISYFIWTFFQVIV